VEKTLWQNIELHIHYKSLLMRVNDHAGCKYFTVALKMFDIFNTKQMYDSVFTGQENASKNGIALYRCFWRVSISIFCLVMHVLYVAYMS